MARRVSGFTLVEVLVGLALFALLSVLLFGGLRFGLRAWEAGEGRIDRAAQVRLVQEALRRQIASTQPPAAIGSDAAQLSSFSGSEQALSFIGLMPVRTEAAGLYRFELGSSDTDGGRQLELRWSVFRWDQPAAQSAQPLTETLLRDIAGVSFSYFGRPAPDGPPRWIDQWDDSWGLPLLVRLSVTFPDGDNRVWPDLVVAPRLRGT